MPCAAPSPRATIEESRITLTIADTNRKAPTQAVMSDPESMVKETDLYQ